MSAPGGSIPALTPGSPPKMLRDALKYLRSLPHDLDRRADAFEALATQIDNQSGGAWQATRGAGVDGSIIFLGRQGEGLAVSPDGKIFRGTLGKGINIGPAGIRPDYSAMTPLD